MARGKPLGVEQLEDRAVPAIIASAFTPPPPASAPDLPPPPPLILPTPTSPAAPVVAAAAANTPAMVAQAAAATPTVTRAPSAWADPLHLTLSFVPDGTLIGNNPSNLYAALNAEEPTATWQSAILSAVQTWASAANINIGVVPDGGQPFGTPGLSEGDSRFGDIRIGAEPMPFDSLADAVPPDGALSGTWAGDILLNSNVDFTSPNSDLYSVMLHEVGHALGLPDSSDPNSVMYEYATGPRTGLAPSDIASLQSLYGPPTTSSGTNTTPDTLLPISLPAGQPGADGSLPVVAYGNLANPRAANYFSVVVPPNYQGPMTVQLVTAGISLLEPQLSVYDVSRNMVGQDQSTNIQGGIATVTLGQVNPGDVYYIVVRSAVGNDFGIGRYGLGVTYDAANTVSQATLDAVLTGPYDSLPQSTISEVFSDPSDVLFDSDTNNNTLDTALALQTPQGLPANSYYQTLGSLAAPDQVNYYSFTTPSPADGSSVNMRVTVQSETVNGINPNISLYDSNEQPVPFLVLTHDSGSCTIQAINLTPGATYYVGLSAPSPDPTAPVSTEGNYSLAVDFRQAPPPTTPLTQGVLQSAGDVASTPLYVGTNELFSFRLSGWSANALSSAVVQMTILDQNGNTVFQLDAPVGSPMSGSVFLTTGPYSVQFTLIDPTGSSSPVNFWLRGEVFSDPIGPGIINPGVTPLYKLPYPSNLYKYPNGVVTPLTYSLLGVAL
jgi:hypothetical protein